MTDSLIFYEALADVLSWRRYDRLMGRTIDIWGWILERLEWLFYQIFSRLNFRDDTDFNFNIIVTIFIIVGVVLVVVAAAIIIRSLIRNRLVKDYNLHDVFEELENRAYTVQELIALSDSINEERYAVRYRYIAALLILGEKQIIKISPSSTNRIIESQIRTHAPKLTPIFVQIANTFHLSWFGFKEVSKNDFENFRKAINDLMAEEKP